ncbi:MAG: hypothetical protein HY925_13165, partial [Elusimicrobia bacterium]|nr:hypothetical protein [Elusimicrobiota bacterium]
MPEKPIDMPKTVTNELCSPEGLFQMAYVKRSQLRELTRDKMGGLSDWPGYAVVQHWTPPSNYFKVEFNDVCDFGNAPEGNACVHSTIALTGSGPVVGGDAGVWPKPTPKFQTRLYP